MRILNKSFLTNTKLHLKLWVIFAGILVLLFMLAAFLPYPGLGTSYFWVQALDFMNSILPVIAGIVAGLLGLVNLVLTVDFIRWIINKSNSDKSKIENNEKR